jgi:hypothetical protein
MATRTCTIRGRIFDIVMPAAQAGREPTSWAWTIEHIFEAGEEILLPGIESVVASDEETAYRRACDRIDQWVRGKGV